MDHKLVITGNPWTLLDYPSAADEWDLDRKLAFFLESGCEAVTLEGEGEATVRLLGKHGLRLCGFFSAVNADEIDDAFMRQTESGAETINCFLGTPETGIGEGLALLERLMQLEEQTGIPAHLETHRATMTESPEFAYRLFREACTRFGRWPGVCWDHSHAALVKHANFDDFIVFIKSYDEEGFRQSSQMHLRPFNGQHAQIPIFNRDGALTPEFLEWEEFAAAQIRRWQELQDETSELWVVPELGPVCHGYGLSIFANAEKELPFLISRIRKLFR